FMVDSLAALLIIYMHQIMLFVYGYFNHRDPHSFPTRRSSDLSNAKATVCPSACNKVKGSSQCGVTIPKAIRPSSGQGSVAAMTRSLNGIQRMATSASNRLTLRNARPVLRRENSRSAGIELIQLRCR